MCGVEGAAAALHSPLNPSAAIHATSTSRIVHVSAVNCGIGEAGPGKHMLRLIRASLRASKQKTG